MWKTEWIKSENFETYQIIARDGKPAVTVWKRDATKKKKLNKVTRKYEIKEYPEKWCIRLSLMVIIDLKPVDTKESAIEIAESELLRILNEIEHNIGFFKETEVE